MANLQPLPLPDGVASKYIAVNDLTMHFLDAHPPTTKPLGSQSDKPPLILLMHGFPELAFSWRHIMRPLADLGYRVVAPDQRGYGRTTQDNLKNGYPYNYHDPIDSFRTLNYVKDALTLVFALGYTHVSCIVGHDFGSLIAGSCAFARPDVFRAVVMMSAPFPGAPALPFNVPERSSPSAVTQVANSEEGEKPGLTPSEQLDSLLSHISPPRMHYTHYFASSRAAADMDLPAPQLRTFLRDYYHIKSADWAPASSPGMQPRELKGWTIEEAAKLPPYYLMPRGRTMPDVVAEHCSSLKSTDLAGAWMSEEELDIYTAEYHRMGFQGGLNKYRCITGDIDIDVPGFNSSVPNKERKDYNSDTGLFSGLHLTVPAMFLSGALDWGPFQYPGMLKRMQKEICTNMPEENVVFVPGAGHWVQQEQPRQVVENLTKFLQKL